MKRFLFLFIIGFLVQSCARVGSPVGGPKDSLAPKFLSSNIDTTRINVSRNIRELRLDFDEYITLKDINKNLIISPPITKIKRILPSNIANKYVLIQWEDTLRANTTYNFNFGNSIVDNNESNVLPYFNFAFSTGDKLDDLYISGDVKDALAVKKQSGGTGDKKLVVGLYQVKDTMNYKQKPYYITKVDDDGYFELNYLSPGKYKIIAFEDENGNSVYDPGKEKVGFQKDPITVDKSVSGLNLKVYPSKKLLKYRDMREAQGGISMIFEGNPTDVKVLSLNDKLQDIKVTHRPKSDTVNIWFDAVKANVGQTVTENLKFSYDADNKKDTVSVFYKYNAKNAMTITNNQGNLLPPKTDFRITSNYVLDKIEPEKWVLKSDSVTTQNFTAKISETNPYDILVQSDFIVGKKYQLTVPKETVSSFYAKNPQSKRFDFEADKVESYGSVKFKIQNAPSTSYWIQLLDSSEKVLYQKYTKGDEVKFDILKPSEYIVRILVDNNENKYWDEADFQNDIFAEDSYVFYKMVVVRPLWDTNENWDLKDTRTLDNPKVAVSPASETSTAPSEVPAVPVDSNIKNYDQKTLF
ncbi:Ig-like domain-containing protein [Chryseobacterium soldanellicola]|uniref:Ig-like domain-containing protein n=1 Tax=Chryseobacterium soldanellicola TaxID=311333 RepID=A0A1H1BHX8_9FLAO|nr:Ig-like domain-containing protein [Chryseobacterium soldanellicola]SDQ51614.1 Ig-like domain-containing protein [Chryseobacterium soldanellicola]